MGREIRWLVASRVGDDDPARRSDASLCPNNTEEPMARRAGYTEVQKQGQERPEHVQGMGDVIFKHFQCLAPTCENFITVKVSDIGEDFSIVCSVCGFSHKSGGETKCFDYKLYHKVKKKTIETGAFVVLHDDYVAEAKLHKYCILCYTMKPVELFSRHASRNSGYQGECQSCKTIYNGIKNQTRITDQHREAAQRRRLYMQLAADDNKIDSRLVFDKFGGKCFNCEKALVFVPKGKRSFDLDHTLPASLLWPMRTDNSTLLCSACNNEKHGEWPAKFYKSKEKLKKLAVLTGYPYVLLSGQAVLNQEAVESILQDVDGFLQTWIPYPKEIKKVRRLLIQHGVGDIFEHAANVPPHLRDAGEVEGG
jgi:5-methylcytosine-specific restriction endonuclease McrA